ncbi:E2/UBC family protein [Domibacillus tundrae]|uniref:E2/UBC family protein n=1 Tax=Domibacillus tundrae TaxID=1587527 RepID=UPI000617F1D4|nr:E2/UBC family protein [Domibacillus tundrae]
MLKQQDKENYFGLEGLLSSLKQISSIHSSNRGPFQAVFEGVHDVEGKEVIIQVALPERFPTEKPMLFLKDPKSLGFLPHLEKDGFICYSHDEGLLLDESNPSGIVKEAFKRADKTLKDGLNQENDDEFLNEFEVLWSRQENKREVDCLFSPGDTFEEVRVLLDESSNKTIIVNKQDEKTSRHLNVFYKRNVEKEFSLYKGIHIPFRKNSKVKPPTYWSFWSMKQLREIVSRNITSSTKKQLQSHLAKMKIKNQDKLFLFFSIPIREGERVFFGVLLENFKRKKHLKTPYPFSHPLKKIQCSFSMIPLSVKRHNQEYLLNRTQGQNQLMGKKAVLLGLGSLGSRIAMELARAGVTSFLFVDNDVIDIDNIYRHELGGNSLYVRSNDKYFKMSKTEAMKRKLLEQFPSLDIDYEMTDVLELSEEEKQNILNSDIIISALGSSTVELALNKEFYGRKDSPPVLYTWIDPMGLGGHALLTNNKSKKGCFRCLFTHIQDNSILIPNRASFAAPNEVFIKTIAGCDSVFTPYGSLDALQTAVLASRLAVKSLQGKEIGNPLLSWKGEADDVLAYGKAVSTRYSFTTEQLYESRYKYQVENCPVCGSG